jgi:Fic-DOC domain mobile mystery protein B
VQGGSERGTPRVRLVRMRRPVLGCLGRALNELEQQNIATADTWPFSRKRYILRERFLKGSHRRMFNRVWRWAGKFRTTERNLGVKPHLIETELRKAIDDATYWVENKTYPPDELAVRFHHRLVSVHPFPNGNGRWSRLVADTLIVRLGGSRFTWGGADPRTAGQARESYIAALSLRTSACFQAAATGRRNNPYVPF